MILFVENMTKAPRREHEDIIFASVWWYRSCYQMTYLVALWMQSKKSVWSFSTSRRPRPHWWTIQQQSPPPELSAETKAAVHLESLGVNQTIGNHHLCRPNLYEVMLRYNITLHLWKKTPPNCILYLRYAYLILLRKNRGWGYHLWHYFWYHNHMAFISWYDVTTNVSHTQYPPQHEHPSMIKQDMESAPTFFQQSECLINDVIGISTRVSPWQFLAKIENCQCVPPDTLLFIIMELLASVIIRPHILYCHIAIFIIVDKEPEWSLTNFLNRIERAV